MMKNLEDLIARKRAQGHYEYVECLKPLLSPSPDAKKIRIWCKKNARPWGIKVGVTAGFEDWEQEIWLLSLKFHHFNPIDVWERASAEERAEHSMRVYKSAKQLAAALNEEIRPYYPPVLEFFEPERAVDILRALPKETANRLLNYTGYLPDPKMGYVRRDLKSELPPEARVPPGDWMWKNPALMLANYFCRPEAQELVPMLENLADYAKACAKEAKRDKRPSVPDANARVFARELAEYFDWSFGRRPNEIIASCVAIKFPQLDPPPDESTIRDWRGVK